MFRTVYAFGLPLLLAILGVGWAVSQTAWWRARRATRRSPKRLFDELATAHRLSPSQRRDCREVAAELGLEEAAALFVRPQAREAIAARDATLAERLYGAADPAASQLTG